MNEIKTTKLTAAKICHEMANYLSIMKFLQEDIRSSDNSDELTMLLDNIDLLTYTMDFFRTLYTQSKHKTSIGDIISAICLMKGIGMEGVEDVFDDAINQNQQNILACILYIIIKASRTGDTIYITSQETLNTNIEIRTKTDIISNGLASAFENETVEEDIYNILIKHAQFLAEQEELHIGLIKDGLSIVGIRVWNI